jgi:hypothetical protein
MATRVASLFAEIGIQDKASDALKAINQYLIETHGYAGLAATAVITAGAAVVAGLNAAKDAAQEYDQAVYQMSLTTGTSAQATSRLIQVMDDAGISQETLTRALKIGVKNGVEPSIEGLAALSDQYLALAPGIDRDNFLLEKFGRNGLEMARAMTLGGDALLRMNGQIESGLVVTQEAIQQSEEYRKNVDALNDSWEAFKISIGNQVIPVLNDVISSNLEWSDAMKEAAIQTGSTNDHVLRHAAAVIMTRNNMLEARAEMENTKDAMGDLGVETESLIESQDREAQALDAVQAALSGDFAEAWDNYVTTLGELEAQGGDTTDEQMRLKTSIEQSTRAMIFQSVAAKADAATQLELGRSLGLVSEEDYNIARATQAIIDQGTPDFVDPAEVDQLKSLADNILKMKGENVPITFDALISASIVDKDQVGDAIANKVSDAILGTLRINTFYTSLNSLTHGAG